MEKNSFSLKVRLADMLKGGVIMDVTTPEQARIAEEAGAVAVMAVEPFANDCQKSITRMSDPEVIQKIQESVSIPVMARCRVGHFVEAQIFEALFIDFIDESELLTPADEENHIDKHAFKIPFSSGCRNLGEALRHIAEGTALIRTREEKLANTIFYLRSMKKELRRLASLDPSELMTESHRLAAPHQLVEQVAKSGKLPVPYFASGGIATPADAALMMQLGAESIYVGSSIFNTQDPARSAKAIVEAVSHYQNPQMLARISLGLLHSMKASDHKNNMEKNELLSYFPS